MILDMRPEDLTKLRVSLPKKRKARAIKTILKKARPQGQVERVLQLSKPRS